MVLKAWSVDKGIEQVEDPSIPVWIQLPGLHPRLWGGKTLSSLASYICAPLATDTMIANKTRMEYARLLVEVNPNGELPETIPIIGPLGNYDKKVIYEWKTMKCSNCNLVGHTAEKCRKNNRKVQEQPQGNKQVTVNSAPLEQTKIPNLATS